MPESSPTSVLRHLLVVGGTASQWAELSDPAWAARIDTIGRVAARHGAQWVTLRPYEAEAPDGAEAASEPASERSTGAIDGCTVIIDPVADGRQRFVEAMRQLPTEEAVNEASVAAALYEPADSEPDLVLVLGPSTALPPSLVWELAYAELVFSDVPWEQLDGTVVEDAIEDFSVRRRRFGGLDDE